MPPSVVRVRTATRPGSWSERDGPAMRVSAQCPCGRALYFRYGVSAAKELVVEDESPNGPAVLRCVGCGDAVGACPCVRAI